MADPIIADHFRVLAVLQHKSALAQDRFVNSWCFRNDDLAASVETVAEKHGRILDAFYNGVHGTSPRLSSYWPNDIISLEYRTYDLGEAPPRTPHVVQSADFAVTASASQLPYEVALCLSLVSERNLKRQRGRLYMGPFAGLPSEEVQDYPTPTSAIITSLVDAATNVLNTTEDSTWCFVSQSDASAKVVTGGWVDNAWDTVRRRGPDPTARTQWGVYTG